MEQLAAGYVLVEGPVYDEDSGVLYFADVRAGGVYALSPDGAVTTAVPHRKGIGGMALHQGGGIIVSGRNVACKEGESTFSLLEIGAAPGMKVFNDLTTDLDGRIYVGSIDITPAGPTKEMLPGFLHVIDLDGSSRIVADGIKTTNGMGVSPDGSRLYHVDTGARVIWGYDHRDDGSLSEKTPFISWPATTGGPDGMAVSQDGHLWVACTGPACVIRFDAQGHEVDRLDVPGAGMVASVCFGGGDLRTLYIATGGHHGQGTPDGGVFRTTVDVPGVSLARARTALPAPTAS